MAYRRIAYAALLGGAVLFQIVFRFYLSTFTLALVLLLPLLSVLLSLPSVLGCTLLLTSAAPTVVQGEDYDLRDYRPGDPLRSVHWKLSSKRDELVVRETLEPRQTTLVLTYDHFGAPAALDQTFARLCTLSWALLERGRPHHIQWASPTGGGVEGRLVDSERALLACLELAFSRPAPAEGRSILDTALRLPGRAGPLRHIHVTPTGLEGGAP